MELIESTRLSDKCDYSFGDQSSVISRIPGGFMKVANATNKEFISRYEDIKKSKKPYMTLFIDNIRLYNREIKFVKESDKAYVSDLLNQNDLLALCSRLSDMNFIIFTGFEDTPIDEFIFEKIPNNVLGIFAANSISFGGKVHPIPYGLKRVMSPSDVNKHDTFRELLSTHITPAKLAYVNHKVSNNSAERQGLGALFDKAEWATVRSHSLSYGEYLLEMKNHKFMISPPGNAPDCDCHRNWELFYMQRIPIVKRCAYLEYLFKGYPTLFVDNFKEVTRELLEQNDHLYKAAQEIDPRKLDLGFLFKSYIKKATKINS